MVRGGWSKDVFPPLELTVDEQRHYRDLARGLVWETLAHYDAHDRPGQRVLDKRRWKAVKRRENLTVYKERDGKVKTRAGSRHEVTSVDMERLAADDWQAPKMLLGVGNIVGSLDDVMYGVVTPDEPSMLLKAELVRSALIDGAVLAQIRSPTPSEPYRFLGIKWFVKGPPASLRGIIWPRDLVFVESTGIMVRSDGTRVGYQLLHSVDIPGYGPLEAQTLMRGRISSCTIFREVPNGRRVDVYVRGYVEQHGRLIDSVALKAASTGFLSSWNAIECAQLRKLLWFIENPHRVDWADRRDDGSASDGARSARSGSGSGGHASPSSSSLSRSGGAAASRTPRHSNRQYPHSLQHHQVALLGSDLDTDLFSMPSRSASSFNNNSHRNGGNGSGSRSRQRKCGSCARKFGLVTGGATSCRLCHCAMCTKCCVAKKVPYVTVDLTLETRDASVCRTCVMHVRQYPSEQVAREEVLEGRYGWQPHETPGSTNQSAHSRYLDNLTAASPSARSPYTSPAASAAMYQLHRGDGGSVPIPLRPRNASTNSKASDSSSAQEQASDPPRKLSNEMRSASIDTISTTLSSTPTLFRGVSGDAQGLQSLGGDSWRSSFNEEEEELERRLRVDEEDEDDWTQTPPFIKNQHRRQDLWQKMTELRLAAENTYRLAKTTTDSVMQSLEPVGHV